MPKTAQNISLLDLLRSKNHHTPLVIGISFLLVTILAETVAILVLNKGVFVFTLDDPYISMALAKNLRIGHYGVNLGEFSAPSSTIFWPFILAMLPHLEWFPLLINVICAVLTVFVYYMILDISFYINDKRSRTIFVSMLLIVLIIGTNVVGLIFTGMEHSLQLLIISMISLGLILDVQKGKLEWWFVPAIVAAPLVRYENLAIACAAIVYLLVRRYYKQAIVSATLIAMLVGAFSLFLFLLGLGPLPSSVIAKTSLVAHSEVLNFYLKNFVNSLRDSRTLAFSCGGIGLVGIFLFIKNKKKSLLAGSAAFAVFLHLLAGQHGSYNRYEIYIWAFTLLLYCYLMGGYLGTLFVGDKSNINIIKIAILLIVFLGSACSHYLYTLVTVPLASNNMYLQQYQMHRFATDYYKKPVAVTDLGLVKYSNDEYVLDLYGLGSSYALKRRTTDNNSEWMDALSKSKHVKLAMIYENVFKRIPENWIKIGVLELGRKPITSFSNEVAFYAMSKVAYEEIIPNLKEFGETLPEGAVFTFTEKK